LSSILGAGCALRSRSVSLVAPPATVCLCPVIAQVTRPCSGGRIATLWDSPPVLSASADCSFLTLVSPCVDLSYMLCAAAVQMNACLLVASLADDASDSHDRSPGLASYIRPVDMWNLHRGAGYSGGAIDPPQRKWTMVYQVRLAALAESMGSAERRFKEAAKSVGSNADTAPCDPGWSQEYAHAFTIKDAAKLKQLAKHDDAVAVVAHLFQSNAHLPHSLARFRPLRVPILRVPRGIFVEASRRASRPSLPSSLDKSAFDLCNEGRGPSSTPSSSLAVSFELIETNRSLPKRGCLSR